LPLKKSPDPVERLVVTTLAIEAAVAREDWSEIESLMLVRQAVVDEVVAQGKLPTESRRQIAGIEQRLIADLAKRQASLGTDLREGHTQSRAATAYGGSRSRSSRSDINL
jgi:hypothetical protein